MSTPRSRPAQVTVVANMTPAGIAPHAAQRAAGAGTLASTGTVLLAALPILVGVQFLVQAHVLDIRSVPRAPTHPRLTDDAPAGAAPPELAAALERHTASAAKTPA